ncbi:MAG: hypothetical protein HQL31_08875 [Planctomycetes bacterium]|nr:hypothetical protein [Planctomycetota bacterium]
MEDSNLPWHKRRKWSRLHEALQRLGYRGGYDAVRRYAGKWVCPLEEKPAEAAPVPSVASTPQVFRAGEAFQFDWSMY